MKTKLSELLNKVLVIFLIAGFMMAQSCATILNSRYQTIKVNTNSDSSTVYVDGQKIGTGKVVMAKIARDLSAKQIKVERPGYKPEYYVTQQAVSSPLKVLSWFPFMVLFFIPPSMDRGVNSFNYKPDISVENNRALSAKKVDQKFMILNDVKFDVKKEDYSSAEVTAKVYEYKLATPPRAGAKSLEDLKIDNTIFADAVNSALGELGYIDTTSKILRSNVNTTYINATVTKMKLLHVYNLKRGAATYTFANSYELTVKWEFLDKYKQVKVTQTNTVKSGLFTDGGNALFNRGSYDSQIKNAMQDAIMNSFYEVMKTKPVEDWVYSTISVDDAAKQESISLTKGTLTKDVKSSMEATTVVKTKKGFGSGCVVGAEGYILTSYHVIAGQDTATEVIFKSGDTLKATIVRVNEFADLALLKVNKQCKTTFFIDKSQEADLAQEVLAIGTPVSMELGQTVSRGVVSGIRNNEGGFKIIQTDVSVSPGNSGGPLVTRDGKFLGIVSSKIVKGGSEGLGFCTPVSVIVEQLRLKYN